jgi:hypothetical protein
MAAGPSDWYLVVPLKEAPGQSELLGSAIVYLIGANDSDEAAQVAFDQGFPLAAVVVVERHDAV